MVLQIGWLSQVNMSSECVAWNGYVTDATECVAWNGYVTEATVTIWKKSNLWTFVKHKKVTITYRTLHTCLQQYTDIKLLYWEKKARHWFMPCFTTLQIAIGVICTELFQRFVSFLSFILKRMANSRKHTLTLVTWLLSSYSTMHKESGNINIMGKGMIKLHV